jgi:DNA polymerase V
MKLQSLHTNPYIQILNPDYSSKLEIPFFDVGISAGFPSPADDFIEISLDLNKQLIKNKDTTFFARVSGHSMKNAGINNGDLLIIDKSLETKNNNIAICEIDGAFTVKRIKIEEKVIWLISENDEYKPIKVTPVNDFMIWGIVIHSIKTF